MTPFTIYNGEGKILRTGTASLEQAAFQAQEGEYILYSKSDADYQYVSDGLVRNMPSKPSEHHTFDYTSKNWVDPRSLEDHKDCKWNEVKSARDRAEFGGFVWEGNTFDSDETSQGRISRAVQFAVLDPEYEVDWALADNSVVHLDAEQMRAVGAALAAHVNAQHKRARTLREKIYSPSITLEELSEIAF